MCIAAACRIEGKALAGPDPEAEPFFFDLMQEMFQPCDCRDYYTKSCKPVKEKKCEVLFKDECKTVYKQECENEKKQHCETTYKDELYYLDH